jgi:hypothetical protein
LGDIAVGLIADTGAVGTTSVESIVVPSEVMGMTWALPTEAVGARGSSVDEVGSPEVEAEQAVNAPRQKTRTHGTARRCGEGMAEVLSSVTGPNAIRLAANGASSN